VARRAGRQLASSATAVSSTADQAHRAQ
jgi:hypothetical protein